MRKFTLFGLLGFLLVLVGLAVNFSSLVAAEENSGKPIFAYFRDGGAVNEGLIGTIIEGHLTRVLQPGETVMVEVEITGFLDGTERIQTSQASAGQDTVQFELDHPSNGWPCDQVFIFQITAVEGAQVIPELSSTPLVVKNIDPGQCEKALAPLYIP